MNLLSVNVMRARRSMRLTPVMAAVGNAPSVLLAVITQSKCSGGTYERRNRGVVG